MDSIGNSRANGNEFCILLSKQIFQSFQGLKLSTSSVSVKLSLSIPAVFLCVRGRKYQATPTWLILGRVGLKKKKQTEGER